MKPKSLLAAPLLVSLGFATSANAASKEVGPGDDVETAMNALQPGDELVLRDGMYMLTDAWHVTMKGTQAAPISVHAKDGEHPHLNRPGVDQNIIDFDEVSYTELRGIEFSGGSAGLRLINVNFMTIQDCEVHDTDDVAIAANSGTEYQGLKILHNHLHNTGGTGEGMYIGCNDNKCRVHDSLFAGNYIHDTNGPNVSQGDGIEIKEGSYNNVVRDNVIHDTGYPCIITYSTVGNGGPNVIERNVLWNCGDHGIQSAADVIIRNNIILGSKADGIANQPHQAGTPSNIQIVNNTILHPMNDAIASTGITGSVLIANNAVYSKQGNAIRVAGTLGQVVTKGNVGMGATPGVVGGFAMGDITTDFTSASFSGMIPNDVFPKAGSKLIGAGDAMYLAADDFNGTLRNGAADVGAYKFDAAGNPGWTIVGGFKAGAAITSDAGVPSGAGGSGATGAGGGSGTGGSNPSGAAAGVGGAAPGAGPAVADESSGCGCRVQPTDRQRGFGLVTAAAVMVSLRRRRPATRSTPRDRERT
jgi:MYXO-CTERM domain-containing protein